MALEAETAYYNSKRLEWIKEGHEDKWAVVHENELIGIYPSLGEGYAAGVEQLGTDTEFLVKQITPEDTIETIQLVYWDDEQQAVKEAIS